MLVRAAATPRGIIETAQTAAQKVTHATHIGIDDTSSATDDSVFVPGDEIKLIYTYQDHTPDEGITLFVSVVPQSGVETAILQQEFHTASTGSGEFVARWTVPWDERFAGSDADNTHFVFRTSQNIKKSFRSPEVTLQMFTSTDGGSVAGGVRRIEDKR